MQARSFQLASSHGSGILDNADEFYVCLLISRYPGVFSFQQQSQHEGNGHCPKKGKIRKIVAACIFVRHAHYGKTEAA